MPSYVRASSVVSRVIAGETLIVPVRGGVGDLAAIYSLNEVASSIWNAIAEPCSKDEIVERIEEEFVGERRQVEQDVESVYDEFNFGERTPYAIRNFLQTATLVWKNKPHYLLLVGDASFDPRNHLDLASSTLFQPGS